MAVITDAKCNEPPSGRSSRVTEVTTTCLRFKVAAAWATRVGSEGSKGPGLEVAILQKRQLRVQVSPIIIKVAVPQV